MNNTQELQAELAKYFNGSDTIWRHSINKKMVYTDGVRAFAVHAGGGAYWMLDILATEPAILREVRDNGIAFVKLTVTFDKKARLAVSDGGKPGAVEKDVYVRNIEWTDCPEGVWEFNFENMMLMLPQER